MRERLEKSAAQILDWCLTKSRDVEETKGEPN